MKVIDCFGFCFRFSLFFISHDERVAVGGYDLIMGEEAGKLISGAILGGGGWIWDYTVSTCAFDLAIIRLIGLLFADGLCNRKIGLDVDGR